MDSGNLNSFILIYLVISIIVFLVCREIACWYFKINKTITLLEEIRDLLKSSQHVARGKVEPKVGDIE